jgi:predicted metal-binding membrane protein
LAHARLVVLVSLIILTAAAWVVTLQQTATMPTSMGIAIRDTMGGAGMGDMAMAGAPSGWSVMGAAVFVAIWTVMMAAMMLPAATPMLLMFAAAQTGRSGRSSVAPTWVFAAGYLVVWAVAGLAVYALVQIGSDVASRLTPANRATWAPLALGATLVAAGVYQFTPLKHICLRHCRSPLGFVMQHWRAGRLGAFRMGLRHGTYCLGCCWALFAVLVAAGVMSLAWMLLLTLVVFAEKVLPQGERASRVVGAAFILLGMAVATGVLEMPWVA